MSLLDKVAKTTAYLAAEPNVKKFALVGSALFHPEPQDVDFLVLMDDEDALSARWQLTDGHRWSTQAGEYDDQDGSWAAFRNGTKSDLLSVNLIVTVDAGWYTRCLMASNVCHALKLMDKGDRIVVHRVVRDGYGPDDANAKRDGTR